MNEFEKLLQEWNKGNFRGSKKKLADILGVDHSAISAWINGRSKPAKDKIRKMSEVFGKTENEMRDIFGISGGDRIEQHVSNNKGQIRDIHQSATVGCPAELERRLEKIEATQKIQDANIKTIMARVELLLERISKKGGKK